MSSPLPWLGQLYIQPAESAPSLYKWVKIAKAANPANDELTNTKLENQKLKAELRRVQEERDILKMPPRSLQN